ATLLLSGADAVRKYVGGGDRVVELRGGLVVPRTPGRAAIYRDDRALVADDENNVAVVGIDPEILVIVAPGRATESHPGFAAIARAHRNGADDVEQVGIFRV